ncbi:MAG: translation initiation factor IF-2 [Nitrospirota bacterium]|jgi:translation initiation factor IF-2
MANIRVHELSKRLGKSNKEVLVVLNKLGIPAKTHSSGVDEEAVRKVTEAFSRKAEKPAPKKAEAAPPGPREQKKPEARRPAKREKVEQKKELGPGPKRAAPPARPPRREKKEQPRKAAPQHPASAKPKERKKPPQRPYTVGDVADILPEEETEMKVPDRFRKDMKGEKMEKFKGKPGMQRAFQAIRKIEPSKRHAAPPGLRRPAGGPAARERPRRHEKQMPTVTAPRKKSLKVHEGVTVKDFAETIGVKVGEVIKEFMKMGYMATVNQPVDLDAALLVADQMGLKLEVEQPEDLTTLPEMAAEEQGELRPRPPIVTIMGHVDHGKTSLLDAIRETKVIETEAGGITQHIGAYKVSLKGKEIVFLDTPGHEAFTALRARGAKVTDIVVLIVAADDGVKPQTVEAIDHARAAGVPIVVAVNKIDKPEANVQRVMGELAEHDVVPEAWGGQTIFAETSAKQRIGIESLLELILLQAEVLELKANPDRPAQGVIIEAELDRGRGPVATVLVQNGTLRVGDVFISGLQQGKVRALVDDMGRKIDRAVPSTPVEVLGFGNVPMAGDAFAVVEDEKKARQIVAGRLHKQRSLEVGARPKVTLDELYAKIKEGDIKDLNIIIKGDVQGSVEAIKDALEGITHPEVKVRVIHSGAGGINESDVMLASASDAIIIGFNVRPDAKASQTAEREGVDIELYNVIYEAIEDVKKALEGMLAPTIKENVLGRAEVRQTFQVSRVGTIAGCMVLDGLMSRNSDGLRVIRDSVVIYEGKIGSLKRFKEDAKEVQSGYECGITVENFNDIKVGDILENFVLEKVAARLS